ncbi:MAG: hypothetical protein IPH62_17635 [Ignavibacteriae bacterium]|nr:hypothetical protein [Ignavibacteriota bacterium]
MNKKIWLFYPPFYRQASMHMSSHEFENIKDAFNTIGLRHCKRIQHEELWIKISNQ